jgi:hypothetical protein
MSPSTVSGTSRAGFAVGLDEGVGVVVLHDRGDRRDADDGGCGGPLDQALGTHDSERAAGRAGAAWACLDMFRTS